MKPFNGNEKKEPQSYSSPGWLIEYLEKHLATKTLPDKSAFICEAIIEKILREKSQDRNFMERLYQDQE